MKDDRLGRRFPRDQREPRIGRNDETHDAILRQRRWSSAGSGAGHGLGILPAARIEQRTIRDDRENA
jgi:hypothetical protein